MERADLAVSGFSRPGRAVPPRVGAEDGAGTDRADSAAPSGTCSTWNQGGYRILDNAPDNAIVENCCACMLRKGLYFAGPEGRIELMFDLDP